MLFMLNKHVLFQLHQLPKDSDIETKGLCKWEHLTLHYSWYVLKVRKYSFPYQCCQP